MHRVFLPFFLLIMVAAIALLAQKYNLLATPQTDSKSTNGGLVGQIKDTMSNPLSIEAIRKDDYPGSEINIEQELDPGSNYKRYLASYQSEGLKIYGLLTVPNEASSENPVPAIIFGHGYIPPALYRTTERYVQYVDSLATSGYVVFKIDYRGHGDSEGQASGAYFSPGYTIDTMNAAESIKRLDYVQDEKLGVWGHSMAGMVVTRIMAAKPDALAAAVIWGGVVGSYEDIQREWWSKRRRTIPSTTPSQLNSNMSSRQSFISRHGEPSDSNEFWRSISPKAYIQDMKTPIQLDHGDADETVPVQLSIGFAKDLENAGKEVELYTYPGSDHDISQGFNLAMQRTIEFFDKHLK